MGDAFFRPTSAPSEFVATEHTNGPWGHGLQHGGPPAALVARAIERTPSPWPASIVRITLELLGPVPVAEVAVTTEVVRSGRSVELVEAALSADGRVAVRARAWRVRRTDLTLPAGAVPEPVTPPPLPAQPAGAVQGWDRGFITAMDTRFVHGGWNDPGPATVWARPTVALVDGETTTGLQRMMLLADCGNGISGVLPMGAWLFINPELTVHVVHEPVGEWLCLDAVTTIDPAGHGLATSRLLDVGGLVGHGAQALLVAPAPDRG